MRTSTVLSISCFIFTALLSGYSSTASPMMDRMDPRLQKLKICDEDKEDLQKYLRCRDDYKLPDLPYAYDALEPAISSEIMKLHHDKHHKAYTDNLNKAIKDLKAALDKNDAKAVKDLLPVLDFNKGGYVNHKMFWKFLQPRPGRDKEGYRGQGGVVPDDKSPLIQAIKKQFESVQKFMDKFNEIAGKIQGSGWCWLVYDTKKKALAIVTTKDQDPVWTVYCDMRVLFGVDAWEHAYYLQYKSAKADYFKAVWTVTNWQEIQRRYDDAVAGRKWMGKGDKK